MKLTADLSKGTLAVNGKAYPVSCKVRTLRGGSRKKSEVVRTIPGGLPYDPAPFPQGGCEITGVEWQKEKGYDYGTYGPVKIRTDAWQAVNVWELDNDGDYYKETARKVSDKGYLLHWSESGTTLGCIRLGSPEDAENLARLIQRALSTGEVVNMEVVA